MNDLEMEILSKIDDPATLRKLPQNDLVRLAREIREYLIEIVSFNGGHLASSLGVVELTIALHYVFNTPRDRLIWDVGHQAYPHKILTGRRERFATIRKLGGLSGFPNITESEYDSYTVGHSSTSLSLAIGEAVARDLNNEDYHVIPIIGDGAMTGGMALEALNLIGGLEKKVMIILNDNNMSISPNVGAISNYLNRILVNPTYNRMKRVWYSFLKSIPHVGKKISGVAREVEWRMKHILIPGIFFEELGIRYVGPVDGHDLPTLVHLFQELKELENGGPILIHILTKKGYGYKHAEENAVVFHGLGPFEKSSGKVIKKSRERDMVSYSGIFGDTLLEMGAKDRSVIAITAAMRDGTGLTKFSEKFPTRFFDVGIAEQNAVTFAASLAARGFKPYVAIYSTFLQRSFDQIVHDVSLMNLPVRFIIDRAGLVGEDGPTHHGVFDIAYLKSIPNLVLMSPKDGAEFMEMLNFMNQYQNGPIAIRIPRGGVEKKNLTEKLSQKIELGKSELLCQGKDLTIISYGPFYELAMEVKKRLAKDNLDVGILNLRFLKPLDLDTINATITQGRFYMTLEDGSLMGGLAESILAGIKTELREKEIFRGGYADEFITHGERKLLLENAGLSAAKICKFLNDFFQKEESKDDRKNSKSITGNSPEPNQVEKKFPRLVI